jgi:hypothetical protein
MEEHLVVSHISSGGMDDWYSLRRICDIPYVVRSRRGARDIRQSILEGSKHRRVRTVYPSHKGHRIYTWFRISGFRRLNSVNIATGTTKSRYAISLKEKGTVWDHKGQ